jgi:hypothetical protein
MRSASPVCSWRLGDGGRVALQLDRLVSELNATVVCGCRRSSFDTTAIAGALAVGYFRL